MAKVKSVQRSWVNGMKRDFSRDQMPPHTAWNAVDLVLNYGAPIRQRGAWLHHSGDMGAVTAASATRAAAGIFAVFATSAGGSTAKCLAIDEDAAVFDVTTAGTASLIGTARLANQNPVFHGGTAASAATAVYTGLVILPHLNSGSGVYKYDGTTLSALGGTPPDARFAAVYKDYTILGNGLVDSIQYTNRAWFSPEGDPDCGFSGAVTAWDTTDSWLDFSQPVRGFGVTKNALLVFGDSIVSRVRGSVPPPEEDMVVDDPWLQTGLFSAFGIAEHRDNVFWAAPEGVFRSDGVVVDDLTKKGGMLRYWLDLVAPATSTWTFAAGVIRDHLIISIMDGTTFKDCLMCDLQSYVWTRHSNVDATSFWSGQLNKADELYWGRRGAARVSTLDSFFAKVGDTAYDEDGDGDNVAPVLETPFFNLGEPGLKRIRRVFVTYRLTDPSGADVPELDFAYIAAPHDTSYTDIAAPVLATTDSRALDYHRGPAMSINQLAPGIALKLNSAGPIGDLSLFDIGVESAPVEQSKVLQA